MARKPTSRPRPPLLRRARPVVRPVAVAALLALTVSAGYPLARATPVFALRTVQVEGAPPALARDVRDALEPLSGRSLVGLERDGVLARLAALPEVRSADYDRAFPDTLVVFVRPERPAAVLRSGSSSWLVSARGRILRPLARGAAPRLPRVWLPASASVESGGTVAGADTLTAVRAAALAGAEHFPVRIRSVRAAGGELIFRLRGGRELRLGGASDLPLKLAVAAAVLPRLAPVAAGGPTYLDVGNPERSVAGGTLESKVEVEGSKEPSA